MFRDNRSEYEIWIDEIRTNFDRVNSIPRYYKQQESRRFTLKPMIVTLIAITCLALLIKIPNIHKAILATVH